ncbi:hypothetical protein LCGC14_2750490 [marine sediment metagenome]|uniref:Uncharacterized protein n=1 Tax=marine sediment metagenome TaxID=412755 RepID=A0A0F8Z1V7_9ZZZZ
MTRKDYVAIAQAFADSVRENDQPRTEGLMRRIANILAEDNTQFDRERFYAACGVVS